MQPFNPQELNQLTLPISDSHKGQNGKLMIIGGSSLFHAASLWALTIASRLVDMVFYASVKENNAIVHELKKEFRNGIIVARKDIDAYIAEADAVLIGPGMMRTSAACDPEKDLTLAEIDDLEDEGLQSYYVTKYVLKKYPDKKWIIDAGALQMMDLDWLMQLKTTPILTPHVKEFARVFVKNAKVSEVAKQYKSIIVLKGEEDVVCAPDVCVTIAGGNAGMTKGGTGDVLSGLIAGLATKNEMFLAAKAGSYFNKKAGESLYDRVGYYFNATDLAHEIPAVMKKLLL